MSSESLSKAELERREKERLEKERLLRLEKIRKATEQYNACIARYDGLQAMVMQDMQKQLELYAQVDELEFTRRSFLVAKEDAQNNMLRLKAATLPTEAEDIQSFTKTLEANLNKIKTHYEGEREGFVEKLRLYTQGKEALAKDRQHTSALDGLEQDSWHEYSDYNFQMFAPSKPGKTAPPKAVDTESVIRECTLLINNNSIGYDEKSQLITLLNDIIASKSKGSENKAALSQYRILRATALRNIMTFDALYDQYSALYVELVRLMKARMAHPPQLLPKQKFAGIAALRQEIAQLESVCAEEDERAYIRQQIDEVMQGKGYKTAQPLVLKNTPNGNHFLFDSKGGELPIRCYISDTNAIMLEPIAIDSFTAGEDAGYDAEFDTNLTDGERQAIFQKQAAFCAMHPEMVKELKERGVYLDVQMREAGTKTAKKLRTNMARPTHLPQPTDPVRITKPKEMTIN